MTQTNEKAKAHNKESKVEEQVEEYRNLNVPRDLLPIFGKLNEDDAEKIDTFLIKWIKQALLTAEKRGMEKVRKIVVITDGKEPTPSSLREAITEAITNITKDHE